MKKPDNAKERNLVKGALRRVFSRSELRRLAIQSSTIDYIDPERPRVKKWSKCSQCGKNTPTYQLECDHLEPIVPVNTTLENMSWDDVVERIWCSVDNLRAVCKDCHKKKTKLENRERRLNKKAEK